LNLNLEQKFQEQRLFDRLTVSKRIDETQDENTASQRVGTAKAISINDQNYTAAKNHQSTFGRLRIETDISKR
jgi:hypothetical protein